MINFSGFPIRRYSGAFESALLNQKLQREDLQDAPVNGSALRGIEERSRKRAEATGLTFEQSMDLELQESPGAYATYKRELLSLSRS